MGHLTRKQAFNFSLFLSLQMVAGQDGRLGVHVPINVEVDTAVERDHVNRLCRNMVALSVKGTITKLDHATHSAVPVNFSGRLCNNKKVADVKTSLSLKLIYYR